jgi:hypothetical protein
MSHTREEFEILERDISFLSVTGGDLIHDRNKHKFLLYTVLELFWNKTPEERKESIYSNAYKFWLENRTKSGQDTSL